jgi:Tol biopolymer transport system component
MINSRAAWSPGGNALVLRMRSSLTRKANLYIVNVDGTGLGNLGRATKAYARRPLWSPDGTILFYSEQTDADQTIRLRLLSVSLR